MRVLVTGAGGFAGNHLRVALRDSLPIGTVMVQAGRRALPGWDESLPFDLLQCDSAATAVRAARPDAVLHLAAQADVAASFADPRATWRANLDGTLALAEAVLAAAPDAAFLFASSAEVYGLAFQAGQPLDEAAPFRPANPYAAAKAAADLALGEMALRGLRAVRLRAFTHVGPGQSARFAVAAFARQVARIEAGRQAPLIRTGALDRWRDMLDVRDVCAGYVLALRAADRIAPGTAFNLASGTPRRIGDALDGLIARGRFGAAGPPRVETEPARLRPTDVERTAGDAAAVRAALGWAPAIPWEATLDSVLEDWRARIGAGEA